MMYRLCFLIAIMLTLSACVTPVVTPKKYQIENYEQKYAPINLDVDAGRYISAQEAEMVDVIYDSFEKSNLFTHISSRYARWPLTLRLKYRSDDDIKPSELAMSLLSAATLLIIPATLSEVHRLDVDIYAGSDLVVSYSYDQDVKITMSLFSNPAAQRKQGVNLLTQKFFNDLTSKHILPTMEELKKGVVAEKNKEELL